MLQSAPPHLRHFIVHLENTMWCTSTPKDRRSFSRFARDYIEAGDYMERIFPLLGVRFISVNDGYDSGMQAGNDVRGLEVAIKNIINASYSRDL